jgi:hypothetical protein
MEAEIRTGRSASEGRTANPPWKDVAPGMPRLSLPFHFVLLCAAVLAGIIAEDSPRVLVVAGLLTIAVAVRVARAAAAAEIGTAQTLCVLFFLFAGLHSAIGYFLADLTVQNTEVSSRSDIYFARSLLVNAAGLLAGTLGYAFKLRSGPLEGVPRFLLQADRKSASNLFRVLVIAGSVLMLLTYAKLGLADYISDPAKWPFMRYITSDLLGGTARDEWLINRAMDLLTISLPFLLAGLKRSRLALDLPLVAAGVFALLLPMRRANLLTVIVGYVILAGIRRGNLYRLVRKTLVAAGAAYVLSQVTFLLAVSGDLDSRRTLALSSTALPEVRDLGWTMSLLGAERLNGSTFLQALLPVPSISSDWSATHSLRAVTTRFTGLDESRESGGLRLTLSGEAFINFGYAGALGIGLLWGLAVGWCERLLEAAKEPRDGLASLGAALGYIWVCFWIYMAGTQAAAAVKMGLLLLAGVCVASRWLSREPQLRPAAIEV